MKKVLFVLMIMSFVSVSYAQKTKLDKLNLKISSTIQWEIPKYSDFGDGKFWYVKIIDVSEKDNKYIVDGEFTYWHVYPGGKGRTVKFQAEVKVILDDFSVTKVIYEKNKQWYRLFPANDFKSN